MNTRVTRKKLEQAADLAKSKGVRVTIGPYVFDPPGAEPQNDDEARAAQERMDMNMGRTRR